jgi:hypothetical protein
MFLTAEVDVSRGFSIDSAWSFEAAHIVVMHQSVDVRLNFFQ